MAQMIEQKVRKMFPPQVDYNPHDEIKRLYELIDQVIVCHRKGDDFFRYGRFKKTRIGWIRAAGVNLEEVIFIDVEPTIDALEKLSSEYVKTIVDLYEKKTEEERDRVRQLQGQALMDDLHSAIRKRAREGKYFLEMGEDLLPEKNVDISYQTETLRLNKKVDLESIEIIQ